MVTNRRLCLIAALLCSVAQTCNAEISDAFAASVTPLPQKVEKDAERVDSADADARNLELAQEYYVVSQPVRSLLQHIVSQAGLRLKMTDAVNGQIQKLRTSGSTRSVLDQVADERQLEWFSFNGIVYVSVRSEATTRLVKLGDLTPKAAVDALNDARLPLGSVETQTTSSGSVLAISGPPELLAIAETIIESVPPLVVAQPSVKRPMTVLIRRGNEESFATLRRHSGATYDNQ